MTHKTYCTCFIGLLTALFCTLSVSSLVFSAPNQTTNQANSAQDPTPTHWKSSFRKSTGTPRSNFTLRRTTTQRTATPRPTSTPIAIPTATPAPTVVSTTPVTSTQTAADDKNPCEEGSYLNLSTDECQPLDKTFGFDFARFSQAASGEIVELAKCTDDALVDQLEAMESSGGTIVLPACTLTVDRKLFVPSNTIVQGAGIGETILQVADDFSETALQMRHAPNVIIRDLTMDGAGSASMLISAWYADNILVERVEARNAEGSGIHYRYATHVTIRYSKSYGHETWHGIASKDCFTGSSPNADHAETCQEQFDARAGEVDDTPGVLWSNNIAIYSNELYDNGEYGLNSHASVGEYAGNRISGNGYGAKFPDGSNLWVHHNQIEESSRWGLFLYNTVNIKERISQNIAFYQNEMGRNGLAQIRAKSPAKAIYLLDNEYSSRLNMLQNQGAILHRCANTDDESLFSYGKRPQEADSTTCDLADVADIFEP